MAISSNNSKGVGPNISLIPIKDCLNCKDCKTSCYALKAFRQYPAVRTSWRDNSRMAHHETEKFFELLSSYLDRKKPVFFRIHVAGDFFSQSYLDGWIKLCTKHSTTKFLAFTKSFSLDYSKRPENLQIVFSQWPGMQCPARIPGIRFAWCQDGTETRIPNSAIECFGRCDTCGVCWSLNKIGKDVVFNIH